MGAEREVPRNDGKRHPEVEPMCTSVSDARGLGEVLSCPDCVEQRLQRCAVTKYRKRVGRKVRKHDPTIDRAPWGAPPVRFALAPLLNTSRVRVPLHSP